MRKILDLLSGKEDISVSEFSQIFKVATMTVRRDLEFLMKQGLVIRTHGGAILAAPSVVAFKFRERHKSHMAEKKSIAKAAAKLVRPGMTIILDTGTSTLELAKELGKIPDIKVLTSSLAIASALMAHKGIELVILGGTANGESPDLSGPLTLANIAMFHAQISFVGADAVDKSAIYTSNQQIAEVSRAMMQNSDKTVLLADSSKFDSTAFVRITGWENIDILISDSGLDAMAEKWVKKTLNDYTLVSAGVKGLS